MFCELENLESQQKATVYFSLGQTSADLNDHKKALGYFYKEMEFYTDPKEVCSERLSVAIVNPLVIDIKQDL